MAGSMRWMISAVLTVAPSLAASYYSVSWGPNHYPEGSVDVRGYVAPGRQVDARVGMFGLRASSPGNTPFDILALCVDARENLFAGGAPQLYAVEYLTNYTTVPNAAAAPNAAPVLSAQRRLLLEQLFFAASNSAISGGNIASAGFQEAVWEIATETLDANPYDGDLTLSSGNVRITGPGDDTQVRDQANSYLGMLSSSTGVQRLRIWSPVREIRNSLGAVTGYERVAGQELLTPAPEPGFYAVLALGLFVAYWRTRTREAR